MVNSTKKIYIVAGVAFVLWTIMFSPWTAPMVDFWQMMPASAIGLTVLTFCLGGWGGFDVRTTKQGLTEVALGLGIAIVLWGVFWVGDKASQWLFPSFARMQVDSIYGMKEGEDALWLSIRLLCLIGPAEELVWRGFIQRELGNVLPTTKLDDAIRKMPWLEGAGKVLPFLITTALYALVHIASCNFMLIMAALVCGVIWGGLYWLFPKHFPAIIMSHALWDAAVFVWFPIL